MPAWITRLLIFLALSFAAASSQFPSPGINVLLFVRADCPITNRYAPELGRIAGRFAGAHTPIAFWLVYPDRRETEKSIAEHRASYHLPGQVLRDADHSLAKRAHVTIAPEAAVFDASGALRYHGRIDDLYVSVGRARPGGARVHDLEEAIAAIEDGRPVRERETKAFGCFLSDVE